jgi:poly-D-alanine transfer protein DltD
MTVQELIDKLSEIRDKSKTIHIGAQGYTTMDDPIEEYEIRISTDAETVLIHDASYYGKICGNP